MEKKIILDDENEDLEALLQQDNFVPVESKEEPKKEEPPKKKRRGRPKGSKNKKTRISLINTNVGFEVQRGNLTDRKERKLEYDYSEIEQITENFLAKYKVDFQIEEFLYTVLMERIDKDIVNENLEILKEKGVHGLTIEDVSNKYKVQLKYEDFLDFKLFVKDLLDAKIYEELEELKEKFGEDNPIYHMYQEIYANVFEPIELTLFDTGMNRLTLITFHYYLKVLESIAKMYLDEAGITNINRVKNPLELFLKDLYKIIGQDDELTKFLLTLKSLTEQWLTKYNNRTKIGDFYYDILMVTPDSIIEKILKYLMFTAIKNKNPLTLRAVFSSYLTLIHQNLFSFYATNLTTVKVGFFKQLENLFTENFSLVFEEDYIDSYKELMLMMISNHVMKNKKYIKNDFHLLNDTFISSFFETNYFDEFKSFDKYGNISFIDHSFLYNTMLKFTTNTFSRDGYFHKINSTFFKKNGKKRNTSYIRDKLMQELFDNIYAYTGDIEMTEEIINKMTKDLTVKLNYEFYLNEKFEKEPFDNNFVLGEIDTMVGQINKLF